MTGFDPVRRRNTIFARATSAWAAVQQRTRRSSWNASTAFRDHPHMESEEPHADRDSKHQQAHG